MEITYIGWLSMVLGIFAFLFRPNWLPSLMIFFIPFSATAIANIGSRGSGSGVQISIFYGALWIAYSVLTRLVSRNKSVIERESQTVKSLKFFVFVSLASLIMPFIIDGKLMVSSPYLNDYVATPLAFSSTNATQAIYVIYGASIAILLSRQNLGKIYRFIQVYLWSGLFVALWGYLQLILYYSGIPYPANIFNNSITPSAQGFIASFTQLNIKRISSVAVEPSVFAQYLVTVIPFLLFSVIFRQPIFSFVIDIVALILMVLILILSTSGTAYVGLMFMAFATFIVLYKLRKLRLRYFVTVFFVFAALIYTYYSLPIVNDFTNKYIFGKADSFSGLERMYTIRNAWSYFLKYPLLGAGLGSVTSHDLVVKLLANTGIIGLASFSFMIFLALQSSFKNLDAASNDVLTKNAKNSFAKLAGPMTVSLLTYLLTSLVVGFDYVFGHFWFILGLNITLTSLSSKLYASKENLSIKNLDSEHSRLKTSASNLTVR